MCGVRVGRKLDPGGKVTKGGHVVEWQGATCTRGTGPTMLGDG